LFELNIFMSRVTYSIRMSSPVIIIFCYEVPLAWAEAPDCLVPTLLELSRVYWLLFVELPDAKALPPATAFSPSPFRICVGDPL